MDIVKRRGSRRPGHHAGKPQPVSQPHTRFETKGRKFSPGQNPPDVALKPFNQITMVHSGSGTTETSYDYTSQDLLGELIQQINPSGSPNGPDLKADHIEMRVLTVKAWNLTGSKIAFSAYDHISNDNTTLCSIVDVGAKDSYPVIGYEFPSAHKEVVIKTGSKKIYSLFTPKGNTVMIYTTLLWRFIGNPKFTFSTELLIHMSQKIDHMETSTRKIAQSSNSTAASTRATVKAVEKLVEAQPGLVSRIVDGVTHIGAYVAPLAADEDTLRRLEELKESVSLLLAINDAPELV